ncbi:ankyrin repeat domain-containing protein [Wolbachia endosymbiont of Diaphorina citri]|nr:ankyrin repeat domain-containing protein [Wolbachia endosymbiont of Diaphorina citri]QJT96344.1 ankyrin repeat domain-containing protein [Wolbachia endosymbiont of Diaphorina citri]QJT97602.1 ankyrin repeat domain-containing protein [Wolbachia endosymbiont of Diaphorina citri]QLK12084.1 ankyrin repeat domain-containing protein [Wolbachia endosymbiont of Diaphorina citri]QXY87634.1 ankyrin repeat domain-containing protein [Wolbachia endosymbiont of Diaphorina citri]
MTLLKIICRKGIKHNEKIRELQEFLNKNIEIPIDKELFKSALFTKDIVDIRKEMVYLILQHCIVYDSTRSKKEEILSFKNVMKILDEAVNKFVTPQYFYRLINFRDQSGNTLLHQAVINNNTDAIEALLKYGASPLIKNKEEKIPLDLDQEEKTREALIKSMKDQAQSKKESARCNSLIGIIPGVFLGIGLGVGGALVPSMTIILCALAVSALVAGIAVGVAIYFLSQDYKQAKSIEEAVNPQLSSVEHEKTADNKAVLG